MAKTGGRLASVVLAALVAASFPTWANTTVGYGKITAIKPVKVEDQKAQTGGALLGGVIGLATGRGQSTSNRALRAVGGGVAGQQVAKLASTKQAYEYTILIGTTTTTVVTDEVGMRVGDCVAVERGAYTNLRLAGDAQCAPKAKPTPTAAREANACTSAKDEVLKAQTDEAFDRAERKMRLLCAD
jgi:outer membrane lipoprotein SlyB